MRQSTIHTPLAKRVRIALHTTADFSLSDIVCPYACISDEETLFWSKAHNDLALLCLWCLLKSIESHLKATVVSKVLTQCEFTICIEIRQYLDSTEEVSILTRTCLEVLTILFCPPVCHITILVIMASLIIESMCHLMTDNHTDGTIVKGIISLRVEEWILKDTCRETDFIRRRIIISIHRLRSHQPLVLVYWLTSLLLDSILCPELLAGLHVLII